MARSTKAPCSASSSISIERWSVGPDESTRPFSAASGPAPDGWTRCAQHYRRCSITGALPEHRLDDGSRMTRECHVRFCERLRGKVLRPTHHFGMKAHIGVDAESGLVHTVIGTSGNVNDVVLANGLLHGEEGTVFADSGYRGAHKRPDAKPGVTWHIAVRPSDRKRMKAGDKLGAILDKLEKLKASVRA